MQDSSSPGNSTTPGENTHAYNDQYNGGPPSKKVKTSRSIQGALDLMQDESIDYPRKRAVVACDICRSRKSKCDGGKPKCKLCTDLGAVCSYREPGVKLDAGDKLILERLNHIESLLQTSLSAQSTATTSPAHSHGTERIQFNASVGSCAGSIPLSGFGISPATNISAMPKTHTTPALHLLQWPVVRDLVSRQCDPQVLMQLEMSREPLVVQTPYVLDLALEKTLSLSRVSKMKYGGHRACLEACP